MIIPYANILSFATSNAEVKYEATKTDPEIVKRRHFMTKLRFSETNLGRNFTGFDIDNTTMFVSWI
jgi:putative ABC transport system permease protein